MPLTCQFLLDALQTQKTPSLPRHPPAPANRSAQSRAAQPRGLARLGENSWVCKNCLPLKTGVHSHFIPWVL